MDILELPLPVIADEPVSWPNVCLAEVWQPNISLKHRLDLAPSYQRRIFVAQEWATIWPKIDSCSAYQYNKRPIAITRYTTSGPQLSFVLEAVMLGMVLPRLYALDGRLKRHQLSQRTPRGCLPLLGRSGTWVGQNWAAIKRIWQQQNIDHMRGLGFIEFGENRIAVQPIPHDSICTDRREWFNETIDKKTGAASQMQAVFMSAPIVTEAQLVARAVNPFKPHYRLNRGLLEKLRLHAAKDTLAPRIPLGGQTTDCSRPHYNWVVVLQPTHAAPT